MSETNVKKATGVAPALVKRETIDQLLSGINPADLASPEVFRQPKKAIIERALGAELSVHLGYPKGDARPVGQTNQRNGTSAKRILTDEGVIDLDVPRDRNGSFEPQLVEKGQRRFTGFDDKIISMYARGMTVREIQGHLEEIYGIEVSPDLISSVTDAVLEEAREWQNRPLESLYPLVVFDALRVNNSGRWAGAQQGGLSRLGRAARWHQGYSRALDRAERGCQVLAQGHGRTEEPGCTGHPARRR